jgi:hypothetical protein
LDNLSLSNAFLSSSIEGIGTPLLIQNSILFVGWLKYFWLNKYSSAYLPSNGASMVVSIIVGTIVILSGIFETLSTS